MIFKNIAAFLIGGLCSYSLINYYNVGSIQNRIIYIVLLFFFTAAFYLLIEKYILKSLSTALNKSVTFFSAFILAGLLMVMSYRFAANVSFYKNIIIFTGIYIGFLLGNLSVILLLLKYSITAKNIRVKKIKIFFYALPCIAIWLLYLIAFYPGLMTYDSLFQWDQIVTGQFNDWHPVTHTWLLWLITRIWFSPAAISLSQILVLSIIFGYSMYSLEKMGVPKYLLYPFTLLFGLMPTNGMLAVTLWKDIWYSAFLLLFTIVMMNIVVYEADWLALKRNKLIFFTAILGVLFFRHNGKFILVPTIILLLYLYRKQFKRIAFICILAFIVFFIVTGPIYKYMNVKPAFEGEAFSVPLNVLAAIINYDGRFTEEQINYINEIMPLEAWKESYNPFFADPIKSNPQLNHKAYLENKGKFLKLLFDVSLQNPRSALKGYADITSIAWRIPESVRGYTFTTSTEIEENKFNFEIKPLNQYIHEKLLNVFLTTTKKENIWIYWRPALPLYFILLFAMISVLKNGIKTVLIPCVVVLNNLLVMLGTPAQDFRYLYANTLTVFPIIAFSIIHLKTQNKVKN